MRKNFMIGGWLAPRNTVKDYKTAKNCGINAMYLLGGYCGWLGDDNMISAIRLCKKVGIDAIPHVNPNTLEVCDKRLKDFDNIPAIMLFDEPSLTKLDLLKDKVIKINEYYGEKIRCEINLLPSYTPLNMLCAQDYNEYLDKSVNFYLQNCRGEKTLSLDFYAIFKRNWGLNITPMWLPCLSLFSKYAVKNNLPLHCFIQTMAFASGNDVKQDSFLLRLQFMVYLAFGFTSFSHFCYASPDVGGEDFFEHQVGIIDRHCKKSYLYNNVKKVNRLVQSFSTDYLKYVYNGTTFFCPEDKKTDAFNNWDFDIGIEDEFIKDIYSSDNIIIGKFSRGTEKALFITYYSHERKNETVVNILFKDLVDVCFIKNYKTKKVSKVDKLKFKIDSGNGLFIQIMRK